MPEPTAAPSLRSTVIKGGRYTATRQIASLAVTIIGVVVLTRCLGPRRYGTYAIGLTLASYAQNLGKWGLDVYLIRRAPEEIDEATEANALALLLLMSGLATALMLAVSAVVAFGIHGISSPLTILLMVAVTPVYVAAQAPLARLERQFRYKPIALVDLGTQFAFYAVAIPLAYATRSAAALGLGYVAQLSAYSGLVFATTRWRLRPSFHRAHLGDAFRFGGSYSISISVWQLRTLVNGLVVAAVAGPAAAGVVALTVRLVETLTCLKATFWRLSVPALGRVRGDAGRLAKAVDNASLLQVLAAGLPLAAFAAIAATDVIPHALGRQWSGVADLFGYVALGSLVNAAASMAYSALYVCRRTSDVTVFNLLHVASLFLAAYLLIGRFGVIGYGYAEGIALGSYAVLALYVRRDLPGVDLRLPVLCAGLLGIALFAPQLGFWVALGPLLLVALPHARRSVAEALRGAPRGTTPAAGLA